MNIESATLSDLSTVREITKQTILAVYPYYYPTGAVDFFLNLHNDDNIEKDILLGNVFLGFDDKGNVVGTITIRENEICRLFVLPDYQGKGYGTSFLTFAEEKIQNQFHTVVLEASLPAKKIYLHRKYKEVEYHILEAGNDKLCYDVMHKYVGE